jgi:mRNA-degrading endonuclease RelE of RelBE toxin-antitoxin system
LIKVTLTPNALKDLTKLDKPISTKASTALTKLQTNPKAGHTLEGSLKNTRALEFTVVGTAYRIAYIFRENKNRCVVFAIGSHENFYQLAARRHKTLKE